jgi:segregation and condensation protein A
MAYEVRLEVFEGPIDLLLHLITRQRVDIYEISISEITKEYLAALTAMEGLDLEVTTGFLVVAATLLELKSARLLPRRDLDDVDAQLLEERDLLLARLVECSTYRAAGEWLAAELALGARWHPRIVMMEEPFIGLVPDVLARVGAIDVARAAGMALAPKPQVLLDTSHVAPIRASVRDAIVDVSSKLQGRAAVGFTELCAGITDRLEIVVRFLALLELFKAGAVDLGQGDRFGDISASWTGEAEPEDMVALVDEYRVEEAPQ